MDSSACLETLCNEAEPAAQPGSSTDKVKPGDDGSLKSPEVEINGWKDITGSMLDVNIEEGPVLSKASFCSMTGAVENVLNEGANCCFFLPGSLALLIWQHDATEVFEHLATVVLQSTVR